MLNLFSYSKMNLIMPEKITNNLARKIETVFRKYDNHGK